MRPSSDKSRKLTVIVITITQFCIYSLGPASASQLSYRSDGPNFEYKSLRDLELTPFVLQDGSWYRDMLTIEASKAVGKFAQTKKFHHFQNNVRDFLRP